MDVLNLKKLEKKQDSIFEEYFDECSSQWVPSTSNYSGCIILELNLGCTCYRYYIAQLSGGSGMQSLLRSKR